MALYVYEKYHANYWSDPGSYYLSWGFSGSYTGGYSHSGSTSYSFNSSTGTISYSGSKWRDHNSPGTVYVGGSSSFTVYSGNAHGYDYQNVSVGYSGGDSGYTRGTFIENVIAEDGTYPSNGRSGSFWYVRKILATPPTVLSPNGGESINEGHLIRWTNSQSGLKYRIELTLNNGQTWSTIVVETAVDATSHTYDFKNTPESSLAKIRITGLSGNIRTASDESDGVFTIQHNKAPTMPTQLSPSSTIVDRTKTQRFSWRHNDNDAQSKALIEWRPQGDTVWTSYTSIGAAQEYFIAENTLPNGQIEWRVRTYDQQGLISPYSAIAVFSSAEPTSAPTILQPADIVNIARPIIEWTGGAQASYQIVLEDSLGVTVWDTGEITSTNKALTAGVDMLNGGLYTIKVRIKDGSGLFSTFVDKTVIVSYTPPAKPELSAFTADGFNAFNIVTPTPTDTQPSVESHEIYKRIDDVWTRVAYGVGSTFNDYHIKSGVTYEYYVKAIGDNGTTSNSDVVSQTTIFRGSWIHTIQDAEATLQYFRYNGTGYETDYEPESAVMKFAGRKRPVVHFGNYEEYSLSVRIQAVEGMSDMDVLRQFVRNRETVCYRDSDGNLIVGNILGIRSSKEYRVSSATITIIETDFNEGV